MDKLVKRDRALMEYLVHKYGAQKVKGAMSKITETINKNNIKANNGN